jgi:hypothetical protein
LPKVGSRQLCRAIPKAVGADLLHQAAASSLTGQVHHMHPEARLSGVAGALAQSRKQRPHRVLLKAAGAGGQPGGVLPRVTLHGVERHRCGQAAELRGAAGRRHSEVTWR